MEKLEELLGKIVKNVVFLMFFATEKKGKA